jgi:hypothetical protein
MSRWLTFVCVVLGLSVVGCGRPAERTETRPVEAPAEGAPVETPSGVGAQPAAPSAAGGEQAFGAPLLGAREPVALSALIDNPAAYTGQVVRTEGEISAVCQSMGCWMELRDERSRAVRVPMAGHAFFLPRDVSGRRALVEGPLQVRPLSAAEREHLAAEGATATDVGLELSATSVVVRAEG